VGKHKGIRGLGRILPYRVKLHHVSEMAYL
jgi:hypothetical protein